MITIRRSADRGRFDHGWLDTRHTFSFADYYDPAHMGFRDLRVINEDIVARGQGFGRHPHRDMEIVSWVVDGALAHKDSLGSGAVLRKGEIQRMSAGTGVVHSEFNASDSEPVHFLQIWIMPSQAGLTPSYEQKPIPEELRRGRLHPMVTPAGGADAVAINQDVSILSGILDAGDRTRYSLAAGRHAWLQVVSGTVTLNGRALERGDGAAISDERELEIAAGDDGAEVLLFDLR